MSYDIIKLAVFSDPPPLAILAKSSLNSSIFFSPSLLIAFWPSWIWLVAKSTPIKFALLCFMACAIMLPPAAQPSEQEAHFSSVVDNLIKGLELAYMFEKF